MNWNEEQRNRLFEDYSSGRITTDEFNEKAEALDKFIHDVEHGKTKKISIRRITMSIIFIPIAIACFFILREAVTYYFPIQSVVEYARENENQKNTVALRSLDDSYVPNASEISLALNASAFIELCKTGSLQQINEAIKNRANVNARNKGWTPLMAAAGENKDPEVIAALIKTGADVNATNVLARTPLILAAGKNSNPEVIRILIDSGADVNPKTDRNTPLMAAASDNTNPKAVTILIKAGADVNAKNVSGRTPLLLAAKNNPNPEVIKTLINAGADVNAKDIDGKTPLIMAADNRNPNPEMITALIKAGGDVNERDKFGLTPLMLAAGNENSTPEVITAIIKTESSSSKASVNINALDENGKTPLIEAAQKNSNPKVIITLLQLGANTIVKDDSGKTAIDYARENRRLNDADTLQKLQNKEYAVPLNTSKQQRATMSDYSFLELCKNGTLQQINNAIKNGANVNARNSLGETPLMLAAFNNSTPEVIAVLVTAGADINAKNNQGVAASDYLRRNERFITSIARRMEDETPAPRSRGFIDYSINDFRFVDLCSIGTFQEIFEAINNGANVNARGSNGMTPLIAAARSRYTRLEVIRILIDAGADINARDIDGMTPLISAARYNINPDMITALLGSGANPRIRDYSGRMAIDYALKNMSLVNTQALRRLEFESR